MQEESLVFVLCRTSGTGNKMGFFVMSCECSVYVVSSNRIGGYEFVRWIYEGVDNVHRHRGSMIFEWMDPCCSRSFMSSEMTAEMTGVPLCRNDSLLRSQEQNKVSDVGDCCISILKDRPSQFYTCGSIQRATRERDGPCLVSKPLTAP